MIGRGEAVDLVDQVAGEDADGGVPDRQIGDLAVAGATPGARIAGLAVLGGVAMVQKALAVDRAAAWPR